MLHSSINQQNVISFFIASILIVSLSACSNGQSSDTVAASSNGGSSGVEQTENNTVVIQSNPQSQTVNENAHITLSVSATGNDLKYQWRKDGESILGATQSTLVFSVVTSTDHGVYDVVVSNTNNTVTSLAAILVINANSSFSVVLNWDIPSLRDDGADLEVFEINGYVVAYGLSAQNLNSSINIMDAEQTTAIVDGLSSNTYYFAIATIDSQGLRGAFSNIIEQEVM